MIIFQADTISKDTLATKEKPEAYQSLISEELKSTEIKSESRPADHLPFWVPMILILAFVMLAWGRLFFHRRLTMIFKAVFAKNYANQFIREGNLFNERIGLVLFMIYLTMMALFVYLAIPLHTEITFTWPESMVYMAILGGFTGLWFFKVIMVKVLSLLFNTNEYSQELLSNMYLFNLFAGIVLLPLVSCMAFAHSQIFFYISLIVIALIYTFRIFREAIIGFRVIKFSVFHLFLYLCTLEILPLIVLAKILSRNMIL